MAHQWRLIHSGHLTGAMNMAIDEAILHSVSKGNVVPTLRFYGWDPPAISIGYFQNATKEVDPAACESLGVDVVRRPTGGRAVLHDVEVTYSLVIPEENPIIPKGITESYRSISEGMVQGLIKLGLDAKMVSLRNRRAGENRESDQRSNQQSNQRSNQRSSGRYEVNWDDPQEPTSAACFDAPSWYEVTVDDKKVVGSAQVRRMGVLLQHGSLPLELETEKLFTCLRFSNPRVRQRAKDLFEAKATSIRSALGRAISFMEVSDAIVEGLQEVLGVELIVGDLTAQEEELAQTLAQEKYAHLEWPERSKGKEIQTA